MKKLLVLLVSAALVLSMAAVSMAAVNVSADWRAEWKSTDADDELSFSKYDLRFNFDGKVSDSIDAHLQITFDGEKTVAVKEYWATFKQSWGTLQAGAWDYKLYPSRVLLKPHNFNALNEKSTQFVATVPFPNGFTFGAFIIPDLSKDAMDWDLRVAYKADVWGAEVHYGKDEKADEDYITFDAYYQPVKNVKVFAYGINTEGAYSTKRWDDDFAPVIGAQFSNIAGSKWTASLEYGLETAGGSNDFNPLGIQAKYTFNNKLALELEYMNYNGIVEDDVFVIRPRIKF